jgi:hypothetical protein
MLSSLLLADSRAIRQGSLKLSQIRSEEMISVFMLQRQGQPSDDKPSTVNSVCLQVPALPDMA